MNISKIGEPMIHMLIAAGKKIDAKCMTLFIGKMEEQKEEAERNGDSKKKAAVGSMHPNGQVYA
jgi:HD-GYP domain-containing protein (c-di-GMP phosphodiesterase class II)